MSSPLVSVVIPVYGKWELTRQCLESLHKQTPHELIEVFVVDNASPDETKKECPLLGKALFNDRFRFISLPENSNFAPACNLGARQSTAPYLFFLNNDTIAQENWLPPLLKTMQHDPQTDVTGPLLLYPDTNLVQHLGVGITHFKQACHLYEMFPADHRLVQKYRFVQGLTGAALLMPRVLFEQLDGFYEGFVNGFEDVDLCLRITAMNKRMRCTPTSRIIHLTSQTPGRFDAEDKNVKLLQERQLDNIFPDVFMHWTNDGYGLSFSPILECIPALTPKQEKYLTEKFPEEAGTQALQEALTIEPHWQKGYMLLSSLYEKDKDFLLAHMVSQIQAYFFPVKQSYTHLARIAALAGKKTEAQKALDSYKRCVKKESSFDFTSYAKVLLRAACKNGNKELQRALKQWFADYGPR